MNLKNVVRIAACAAATGVLAVALVGCGSSSSQHQIAVPSDATNEARALLLLQDEGLAHAQRRRGPYGYHQRHQRKPL